MVVVVVIEDPAKGDFWASTVAAPVFSEIASAAVGILDIPPTVNRGVAENSVRVAGGSV